MISVAQTPTPSVPPERWTGAWVRSRLRQAFEVEQRLPSGRRNGGASAWPFEVTHEFSEMVGWLDARQRVWDNWARARGAYPFEITRMDEALGWLALLRDHDAERRCLAAWALLASRGKSVRLFLARRRWSRTTFYRRVEDGSNRIAAELARRGAEIR
jgi:hypothetical protein